MTLENELGALPSNIQDVQLLQGRLQTATSADLLKSVSLH